MSMQHGSRELARKPRCGARGPDCRCGKRGYRALPYTEPAFGQLVLHLEREGEIALFPDRRFGFLDNAAVVKEARSQLDAPVVGGRDETLARSGKATYNSTSSARFMTDLQPQSHPRPTAPILLL